MFGMTSQDTCFAIALITYGVYCAWVRFCECKWPEDRHNKDEDQ